MANSAVALSNVQNTAESLVFGQDPTLAKAKVLAPAETSVVAEAPAPIETSAPVEALIIAEIPASVETPVVVEVSAPVEAPGVAEVPVPVEAPVVAEITVPAQVPVLAEVPAPAEIPVPVKATFPIVAAVPAKPEVSVSVVAPAHAEAPSSPEASSPLASELQVPVVVPVLTETSAPVAAEALVPVEASFPIVAAAPTKPEAPVSVVASIPVVTPVLSEASSPVVAKVSSPVIAEALSPVADEASSSVAAQVPSSVVAKASSSVTAEASSSVIDEAPSSVAAEVPSSVSAEVQSSVSAEAPSSDAAEAPSSVAAEVPSSVVAEVSSSVVVEAPSSVAAEVPSSVTAEASSSVAAKVPSSVAAEVPSPVIAEASSSVAAKVPSSVSAEVQSSVSAEAPSSVTAEASSSVAAKVPSPVIAEAPSSVAAEASSSVAAKVPSSEAAEVPSSVIAEAPSSMTVEASKPLLEEEKLFQDTGALTHAFNSTAKQVDLMIKNVNTELENVKYQTSLSTNHSNEAKFSDNKKLNLFNSNSDSSLTAHTKFVSLLNQNKPAKPLKKSKLETKIEGPSLLTQNQLSQTQPATTNNAKVSVVEMQSIIHLPVNPVQVLESEALIGNAQTYSGSSVHNPSLLMTPNDSITSEKLIENFSNYDSPIGSSNAEALTRSLGIAEKQTDISYASSGEKKFIGLNKFEPSKKKDSMSDQKERPDSYSYIMKKIGSKVQIKELLFHEAKPDASDPQYFMESSEDKAKYKEANSQLSEPLDRATKTLMDLEDQVNIYLNTEEEIGTTTFQPQVYGAVGAIGHDSENLDRQLNQIHGLVEQINGLTSTLEVSANSIFNLA